MFPVLDYTTGKCGLRNIIVYKSVKNSVIKYFMGVSKYALKLTMGCEPREVHCKNFIDQL